jgi:hypothetical protein
MTHPLFGSVIVIEEFDHPGPVERGAAAPTTSDPEQRLPTGAGVVDDVPNFTASERVPDVEVVPPARERIGCTPGERIDGGEQASLDRTADRYLRKPFSCGRRDAQQPVDVSSGDVVVLRKLVWAQVELPHRVRVPAVIVRDQADPAYLPALVVLQLDLPGAAVISPPLGGSYQRP